MTGGGADGLTSTRGIAGAADRATLLVTTGVSVQAVIIHPTLDLDAGNVGVTLVSLLAGANWFVLQHSAEGVIATRTRVFADLVDTGVGVSAVVICATPGHDGGQGLAAVVLAGHEAIGTRADHCSDRQRVDD